ncbi:MAG: peptidoglycan-binding domain-containing protein [Candidatus Rokuibacteriota bacterium]
MITTMIYSLPGSLWRCLTRPVVFFPLMAALAVLSVYGVVELGLAMTGRWERDLTRRMDYYRDHQPEVLVIRYQERLQAVQVALKRLGYDAGPADAAMGPLTAEALRAFQRRQGLRVTGRPDPQTLTALGLQH